MARTRKIVMAGMASIARTFAKNANLQKVVFNSLRLNRVETRDLLLNDDIRFIAYCLARRNRSRSQIMQDLWVCFELGEKEGGYFVEFGATNGVKNSNTWLLEKQFGWNGILAEPNPLWHGDLANNRASQIEHKCVASKSNDFVSFITTNETDPELSAIAEFSDGDHFAETRSRGEIIQVETISLDDLLEKYKAPAIIDYISIDTEGSEFPILSAYSFTRRFRTISVENNPKNEGAIERLLNSKGYVRVFKAFSQWDSWFVSRELRDGPDIFIVAPEA